MLSIHKFVHRFESFTAECVDTGEGVKHFESLDSQKLKIDHFLEDAADICC